MCVMSWVYRADTVAYDPDAIVRTRPDQAERLRQQREVVAHDSWFRAQVREALQGIETGANPPVDDEEVRARLEALSAGLARRAQERRAADLA